MIGVRMAHRARTKEGSSLPEKRGKLWIQGNLWREKEFESTRALCFHFLGQLRTHLHGKWLRLRWGEEPWQIWLLFLGKKENLPVAVRGAQRGIEDYQVAVKTKLSSGGKKIQVTIIQIARLWDFSWLWRNQRHNVHYEVKAGSCSEVVWWTFNGLLYDYFWDFFLNIRSQKMETERISFLSPKQNGLL